MNITIAAAGDIDSMAAIERLCFSVPWTREMIAGELDNPCSVYLLAKENGTLLGYAGLHRILDEGYITNIATHPDHRGKGVAKSLMRSVLEYAAREKLSFLTLEVRVSNAAAVSLYESFGFRLAGRRKGYYTNPVEDALLMTLDLPA